MSTKDTRLFLGINSKVLITTSSEKYASKLSELGFMYLYTINSTKRSLGYLEDFKGGVNLVISAKEYFKELDKIPNNIKGIRIIK